jgi:hypothetical protein
MRAFGWALVGFVAGALGFSMLVGGLEDAFRPYPDDMQMWLLYSLPAGAIFGSITGCVLGLASKQKSTASGVTAIISSLGLGFLHLFLLSDALQSLHALPSTKAATTAYAYAQYGPGLLWSVLLLAFGIHCFFKRSKASLIVYDR